MKVKTFWLLGMPPLGTLYSFTDESGKVVKQATVVKVESGRCLVSAEPPIPFELLEASGIGFGDFEDTED